MYFCEFQIYLEESAQAGLRALKNRRGQQRRPCASYITYSLPGEGVSMMLCSEVGRTSFSLKKGSASWET